MKKTLIALFMSLLILTAAGALAEPLLLREDLAGELVFPFDESNPSAGSFVYTYAYPQADESDPRADLINVFYRYLASDAENFSAPILADFFRGEGISETFSVTYQVTCSNEEYFSVLMRTTEAAEGQPPLVTYEGHVFSLLHGTLGSTYTLPEMVGVLAVAENDDWLQSRQAQRMNELIRGLVWDRLQEAAASGAVLPDEEAFSSGFFPEQDFYLDATGEPVFFLQPGMTGSDGDEPTCFRITMEEIRDEM